MSTKNFGAKIFGGNIFGGNIFGELFPDFGVNFGENGKKFGEIIFTKIFVNYFIHELKIDPSVVIAPPQLLPPCKIDHPFESNPQNLKLSSCFRERL